MVVGRLPQNAYQRGMLPVCTTVALWLMWGVVASSAGEEELEFLGKSDAAFADLYIGGDSQESEVLAPDAAKFDQWESICEECPEEMHISHRDLLPFDWFRHFGFRHSSSHGRSIGKGLPLKGTSWLNRPYHCDLFLGPLLGDDLIKNRVSQTNVLLGGLRLGWDFDYYWGSEWRIGWANPNADFTTPLIEPNDVKFLISDVSVIYYPWGDSKVRPYWLLGAGFTRLEFTDDLDLNQYSNLFTMPFGGGIRFRQHPWLAWRLEVVDNLAFGADNIDTMNNISLTASMEMRFGAKPATYWPWRTSRKVW